MLLQVEHRKVWCATYSGVPVEKLEFVEAHQRVTCRLGAYAAELFPQALSRQAVVDHLDLNPKTVNPSRSYVLRQTLSSICST